MPIDIIIPNRFCDEILQLQVVRKMADIYAERLMSDVLLVVGDQGQVNPSDA